MQNRERIVIYALLAVLLALNLRPLLDGADRPAFANPIPGAGDLGPADAVILGGDDGELSLRNRGGRLTWGEQPHQGAYSVAYVFIGEVLNKLMRSEALEEDRSRLAGELREEEAEFREQLESIGGRLQDMDPESEEAKRIYEGGSSVYKEYMEWQQQALARRGKLEAQHLERVYRELVEAVEVVADRKGIDTVYRFIPTNDPFNAENPDQAMMSIRLRSALRYPDELDITEDVLEELGLDTE